MKIIILATFTLLIAGLIISFSSMKKNEINNPQELEIAHLETRKAQLEAAAIKGRSAVNLQETLSTSNPIEVAAQKQADLTELARVNKEIEELRASQNNLEEQTAVIVENAIIDKSTKPKKKKGRTNLVQTALVMARVTEYDSVAKIAEVSIKQVGNVNSGDILGIRRNGSIIGRVLVGTVDLDRGIIDPIPESFPDGKIDLQLDDELILPPDF